MPLATPGWPIPIVAALVLVSEFVGGLGVMILDINAGAIIPARTPHAIRSRVTGALALHQHGNSANRRRGGRFGGRLLGVRETMFVASIGGLCGVLWLVRSQVLALHEMPETAEI